MDGQRQDDQLEPIYNNSVPIQDIALKTFRERWTIEAGGKRGSGGSVLAARHDDGDDDETIVWCQVQNFKLFFFRLSGV